MYTVYLHRNKSNNKVYVGITSTTPNKRWKNGWGYSNQPLFHNAIQKYGWDGFVHEIVATELSREDACELEKQLISTYRSHDRDFGYNIDLGGFARGRVSEQTKQLLREKNLGRKMSKESRMKMSDAKKGIPLSEEHKKKLSVSLKGRAPSEKQREIVRLRMMGNTLWLGKHLSEETKDKIRQKALGREFSDEWRKHLSESHIGIAKGEKNHKSRKVVCVETGEIFPTITDAAKSVGITHSRVRECCLGIRKTTKGYHWQFYDAVS